MSWQRAGLMASETCGGDASDTCGGDASDTVSDDVRITANGLPCFHCPVSPEQPGCSLSVDTIEPLG